MTSKEVTRFHQQASAPREGGEMGRGGGRVWAGRGGEPASGGHCRVTDDVQRQSCLVRVLLALVCDMVALCPPPVLHLGLAHPPAAGASPAPPCPSLPLPGPSALLDQWPAIRCS